MGNRKISVRKSAAESIAAIAFYIEAKGMVATAEKFANDAYDFIDKLGNEIKSYAQCREPLRAALGYKCVPYKKKYTIVFIESAASIIVVEFNATKNIYW